MDTLACQTRRIIGRADIGDLSLSGQLGERPEFENKTIVCFFYDSEERHLTTPSLFLEDNVVYKSEK